MTWLEGQGEYTWNMPSDMTRRSRKIDVSSSQLPNAFGRRWRGRCPPALSSVTYIILGSVLNKWTLHTHTHREFILYRQAELQKKSFSRMATMARTKPLQARNSCCISYFGAGPKYLGHQQEAGLEVNHWGLKLVPMQDAGRLNHRACPSSSILSSLLLIKLGGNELKFFQKKVAG